MPIRTRRTKTPLAAATPADATVPDELAAPHRLVAAVIEANRQAEQNARRHGWPIQSQEMERRRLRILNALYQAIEKRGHHLDHPKDALSPVWCVIDSERIDFHIIEYLRLTRVPLSPEELRSPLNIADGRTTKSIRKPTALLVLLANAEFGQRPQRWPESSGRLEDRVDAIVMQFERMAKRAAARRIELAELHREMAAEIARRNERQARDRKEAADWERLRGLAADWSEAQRLRRFIDAIAGQLRELQDPDGHGRAWLDWAKALVDELDPLGKEAAETLGRLLAGQGLRRKVKKVDEEEW